MQSGSPTQISQHPRNEFVAAFMGDNNLLHGSVKEARDGQVVIEGDLGTYEAPAPPDAREAGSAWWLPFVPTPFGSRPDRRMARSTPSDRIHITEYLGDIVKVHMHAGERPLLAKVPESRFGEVSGLHGEPVVASWNVEDVQILDA